MPSRRAVLTRPTVTTDKSSRSLTNEPERPVSGGPTGLPASVFDADYCDIPDDPSPLSHEVAVGIFEATIRGEELFPRSWIVHLMQLFISQYCRITLLFLSDIHIHF
jgi:hypothetical protein